MSKTYIHTICAPFYFTMIQLYIADYFKNTNPVIK